MPVNSKKEILKTIRQRKYLNKDFDGFKADLLEYARTHYPDHVRDFSEPGLAGLLLDFAAYVGDVDSFYLDHQYHELDSELAEETRNIQSLLRRAGVPITGASPAVVYQTFYIEVPATNEAVPQPDPAALPIIQEETVVPAENGVQFELTEGIDFNEVDEDGELKATVAVSRTDNNNTPTAFILSRRGLCISGFRDTSSFSVGAFEPFKTYTLPRENVTEVIACVDSLGKTYYKVEYLTQDTVFEAMVNKNEDNELVKDTLVVTPAPYRYVANTSLETRLTTLTFGGGSAQSLDDDVIPDPSEFALPLYGKRNFSRFTLDPATLLQTTTLGVISPNSTITVSYRYGGGLSHNVGPQTIRGITTLRMFFPNDPTPSVAQFVRSSADSLNEKAAAGGEDAPTIDDLKLRIPATKAAQSRIVTRSDLIARIYTMPSNFGRVFRASVRPDPNNPLASRLYIVSRNASNRLIVSPDSLKENLSTYLNEFRLSNDAIDIVDALVINIMVEFSLVVDPSQNRNLVKQNVIRRLKDYFEVKNFEIDQPIFLNDLENIVYNNVGVLTVSELTVTNINGTVTSGTDESNTRVYSSTQFDVQANTEKKIIFGPPGSIFEVRFPDYDIKGVVI